MTYRFGRAGTGPALVLVLLCSAAMLFAQDAAPFISIGSDWSGSVFGDIGGQDKLSAENFEITERPDGSVALRSANDRGKIASTSEGIAFYYKEIPAGADFELTATAAVESFKVNNQVSFGLMARDTVFMNESVKENLGSYLAVGPINTAAAAPQYTFSRTAEGLVRRHDILKSPAPASGAVYTIGLRKTGDLYVLSFGGEEPAVWSGFQGFPDGPRFVGLFTSRNAAVSFSDISLRIDTRTVTRLEADSSAMKHSYLEGEPLDLSGLEVTAVYDSGETERLGADLYVVTGFDSSRPGDTSLAVQYGGRRVEIPVTVLQLRITSTEVVFPPVRTEYHLEDTFDPAGFEVTAVYNRGFSSAPLEPSQYRLEIAGNPAEGYVFSSAGTHTVTLTPLQAGSASVSFPVTVAPARLSGLEIGRLPEKTRYFTGERFDPTGMTVYARYGSERVRLSPGEFTVSELDTREPGRKSLTVTHKNLKTTLALEVARPQAVGLEIVSYPKTTYTVGERFDRTGLEVARVYDNGRRERLPDSGIGLDLSGLDTRTPGTGTVRIVPAESGAAAVPLPVTVRPRTGYEWRTIRFGQSTSDARNTVQVKPDGTVVLTALEGGGKVTGDHDGITYYYAVLDAAADNFVLEADIRVTAFAKTPHDGQESFGIMARDAIGPAGSSAVFASNIAAVGGYSGGTRNDVGTQLFIRTGVTAPDGTGSEGVKRIMLRNERPSADNTHPAARYRLTLAKTNSGFSARLNDGPEVSFPEPEILSVQDGKLYVGFFTARLATIEVSDIRLTVTAAATDALRKEPPAEPVAPALEVLSLTGTSSTAYTLRVRANTAGTMLVKQGYTTIARELPVRPDTELRLQATLTGSGANPFTLSFLPDDRLALSSYEPVLVNHMVVTRSYVPGGDLRVSPAGSPDGDGTAASSLDLDTAVAFVREGQRIVLDDGVYKRSAPLVIGNGNNGKPGAMKYLVAASGARPVIDFLRSSEGVIAGGDYWHVKGIDFARSAPNTKGFTIGGDHNIVEECRFYEHGDTGLQISRTDPYETSLAEWPSYNLVLNCESFDNRDPSENNADGFAAKLTSGVGNVFRGCVAHHNIDDGWDLYTKAGSGAIGPVVIEACVAYENGTLSNGAVGKGDKNGFKLGGEGIAVPHVIRGSLAFGNGATGFTNNSNPSLIAENNFSYDNGGVNLNLSVYPNARPDFRLAGFRSFRTGAGPRDIVPAGADAGGNFLWNGSASVDRSGAALTLEAFTAALEQAGLPVRAASLEP